LAQAQLSEAARRVLEVDEESFKGLVRELARSELLKRHDNRRSRLADTRIVLGHIRRGVRRYEAVVEAQSCREDHGSGQGVFYVYVTSASLELGFHCVAGYISPSATAATIWDDGEVTTSPQRLYYLYHFLYKWMGIGDRPLLELARQVEEKGDREVASILRKIYAVLEVSRDIIEEIRGADHSTTEARVEEEVKRKVEEAVMLLRRAKELARKGDTKNLRGLLDIEVVEAPRITLSDIINHLKTGQEYNINFLLSTYRPYTPMLINTLREEDIYDTFITVAEHFGLEIKRP